MGDAIAGGDGEGVGDVGPEAGDGDAATPQPGGARREGETGAGAAGRPLRAGSAPHGVGEIGAAPPVAGAAPLQSHPGTVQPSHHAAGGRGGCWGGGKVG